MLALAGILAGIIAALDTLPYLRDIHRGVTRPYRPTWGVWSVLGISAFAAQVAADGGWSLVPIGAQAVLVTLVFLIALRRGEGRLNSTNVAMLLIAATGLMGWMISDSPLVATLGIIVADLVGCLMMVPKAWSAPHSETLSTYALASLSGLFATVAVGRWDVAALAYPAFFTISNGALALLLASRRRALASPASSPSSVAIHAR